MAVLAGICPAFFPVVHGQVAVTKTRYIYDFSEHWGMGVGLNYYRITLKAQKPDFSGKADFGYWGPSAFVRYAF